MLLREQIRNNYSLVREFVLSMFVVSVNAWEVIGNNCSLISESVVSVFIVCVVHCVLLISFMSLRQ